MFMLLTTSDHAMLPARSVAVNQARTVRREREPPAQAGEPSMMAAWTRASTDPSWRYPTW